MLDDFFTRAILAGMGVALVAGPLGCFIVWRRLAYFGDTLSHAALLGVALAFLFEINITLAVFGVSACVSIALLLLQRRGTLSSDALLGLLAHSALALGLVALAFMTWIRMDLMGFLFGDILAVSKLDIAIIWLGGAVVLGILTLIWRPLFAATINRELAEAEGMNPERVNIIFMLLMAAVIAISMKIVGVLLITAMLIIPAATARRFSSGPEQMAHTGFGHRVGGGHWWPLRIAGMGHACRPEHRGRSPVSVHPVTLSSLFAQESPDRGAGEERERTPERNPVMNEHVHETVDLTKNQSLVMGALTRSKGPLSAYTILDQLRDNGFRAPLQVYRALDKLVEFGMVHRLESLNAFVACRHPGCDGDNTIAFMICERCGQVNEITDNALAKRLKQLAGDASFALKKTTIELRGICHTCQVA
jgi:zinc transport system permease protein